MIREELCAKRLSEPSCLSFDFESLDLVADALVSAATCPFWLGRKRLANIWPTAELEETQFRGGEAFTADLIVFLGRVGRSMAIAAGIIAVVAK